MVTVIGGGASGMMAALTAARQGKTVRLLERQARVGRKLLSTGNGRCNLTNLFAVQARYHGQTPAFVRPALEAFSVEDTLEFFHGLGLLTVAEPGGRVYPLSDQAGSVVDVLRLAVEAAGVEVQTAVEVLSLERKKKGGFRIRTEDNILESDQVIICCGGMAGGKLGGTQSGYELLKSMGHHMTKLYPALVQIKTDPTYVRALKGVRAQAQVTLAGKQGVAAQRQGELQFTDFGVSGPVVFDLSRTAATAKEPMTVHMDFLHEMEAAAVARVIRDRLYVMPDLTMENLLTGILHNRLGRTVLRYAGYTLTDPISILQEKDVQRIVNAIKDFAVPVIGVLGFDGAQVTAGGIQTSEFDAATMESRLVPGLYAAGEVLDIDGDCGGFNLQWAWSSGHLAGMLLGS